MPSPKNLASYPQYARDATSYVLVDNPTNPCRPGTLRFKRWGTIVKYSGHPNGVALAMQEGGVTKRHLHMLERQGQLRLNTSPGGPATPAIADEDDKSRFPEGAASYKNHRVLERDSKIARLAKQNRFAKDGVLACDVCGFDFGRTYGPLGRGYIEAHHTVPVAVLAGKRKTSVDEFALVCSNCHRMLHTGDKLLSLGELQSLLRSGTEREA
ncbi:hypothetical protein AGMMS50256_20270 [Betaproteobacteria bacterium]|nr:hypothetical protein AGMMS50256_20270 [Betaproteobacteria bacterium]